MIVLGLEEFAAKRRPAQERVEDGLRPIVERALDPTVNTGGWSEVLMAVSDEYQTVYAEESGGPARRRLPATLRDQILQTLRKTDRTTADSERITVWLSTLVMSTATLQASEDDPDDLFMEWVDMGDSSVREAHRAAAGQVRPVGEKFDVGGSKMAYPGDPSVDIELWINCRCTLRPVLASEELVASAFGQHDVIFLENRRTPKVVSKGAKYEPKPSEGKIVRRRAATAEEEKTIARGDWVRVNEKGKKPGDSGYMDKKSKVRPQHNSLQAAQEELGEPTHAGLAVVAADSGRVLMLQRTWDEEDAPEVRGTWEFPGGSIDPEDDGPQAAAYREFSEETGLPVPEGEVTNGWRSPDGVYQGYVLTVPVETDAFDEINPDLAAAETVNPDDPERRNPDVTAWFTVEQIQNLGPALRPEVARMDFSVLAVTTEESPMPDEIEETPEALPEEVEEQPRFDVAVPWHGVLAPEGVPSGDRRSFAVGSLRTRPLPLPLTWQKAADEGHKGNVTVAKIDRIERVGNEMRASGTFLSTLEADEVIAMIAEFGRFGVSIDADDATMEASEDGTSVTFTDGRIASASIVAIPAFAEAWVALGDVPEDWWGGEAPEVDDSDLPEPDALVAAAFADVAPGKTEDGPGWLTHPVDTDRLRDYWVSGPGAAKIGWGSPGDFNRCRTLVAEYVKPQHISGYCANRHYDALGSWPGRGAHAGETLEFTERAEEMTLVASGGFCAPSEWFADPEFTDGDERLVKQKNGKFGCPLTITEEGRVFGHIALWNLCHTSWSDRCVLAPHSSTNYAHFLLGEVLTTSGPVACGSLTIGGGHAGPRMTAREALAHYDSTSTAWADVTVGEDAYGIWFAGWVRPGTPDEMVTAARASKISGDWRKVGAASMEMVAALSVNVPGFPVARIAASFKGSEQNSLVAAGVVAEEPASVTEVDSDAFAAVVAQKVMAHLEAKQKMAALRERFATKPVIGGQ